MRLNKDDKEAFVKAVIDDVPTVNYDEQARLLAQAAIVQAMPLQVCHAYKSHPEYFEVNYINTPGSLGNICVPSPHYVETKEELPDLWAKLSELAECKSLQEERLDELRSRLYGIITSCGTLKTAKERLPEFAKYLPADRDSTGASNVPVSNVLADLQVLGWPK